MAQYPFVALNASGYQTLADRLHAGDLVLDAKPELHLHQREARIEFGDLHRCGSDGVSAFLAAGRAPPPGRKLYIFTITWRATV